MLRTPAVVCRLGVATNRCLDDAFYYYCVLVFVCPQLLANLRVLDWPGRDVLNDMLHPWSCVHVDAQGRESGL